MGCGECGLKTVLFRVNEGSAALGSRKGMRNVCVNLIIFFMVLSSVALQNSVSRADPGLKGSGQAPKSIVTDPSGTREGSRAAGRDDAIQPDVIGQGHSEMLGKDDVEPPPLEGSSGTHCMEGDCDTLAHSTARPAAQSRVKAFSEKDVFDIAFSSVSSGHIGPICLVPGLDSLCSVLHKDGFCWVSLDGGYCTLSEGHTVSEDELAQDTRTKDKLLDDEQGKPEVQQITQKVLEVLPEAAKVNFALSRDGAKVLASNQGAKRVGALLDDDSDTFMRNECKDNKWVVIELSQVARVSSLEIAQNELYSSRLKEFSVYGMQSHPRTLATLDSSTNVDSNGWSFMGKFEGKKAKGVQVFAVDSSKWVRYLLVRFLTHHGAENVCAINELAVYGISAAEELEAQLASDELVFDSIEDATNKEMVNEDANTTSVEAIVPDNSSRNDLGPDSNTRDLHYYNEIVSNQSDKMVLTVNGSTMSDLQRIISENVFSSAASNHSSSEKLLSQICLAGDFENIHLNNEGSNNRTKKDREMLNKKMTPSSVPPPMSAPGTDDLVPIPKPKSGGNLYETLIQELRATKAQQKIISKSLEGMHKHIETVAGELSSLRKSSELLDSVEIQQKIEQMEQRLHQISTISSNRSIAAISLLAAAMSSIILRLEMFSSPSKSTFLMDIAKGLVALNILMGAALILKGSILSI